MFRLCFNKRHYICCKTMAIKSDVDTFDIASHFPLWVTTVSTCPSWNDKTLLTQTEIVKVAELYQSYLFTGFHSERCIISQIGKWKIPILTSKCWNQKMCIWQVTKPVHFLCKCYLEWWMVGIQNMWFDFHSSVQLFSQGQTPLFAVCGMVLTMF